MGLAALVSKQRCTDAASPIGRPYGAWGSGLGEVTARADKQRTLGNLRKRKGRR